MQFLREREREVQAEKKKVASLRKELQEARSKHPERDKSAEARQHEPPAEDGEGAPDEAMECTEQDLPGEISALQATVDAMDAVPEKAREALGPSYKEKADGLRAQLQSLRDQATGDKPLQVRIARAADLCRRNDKKKKKLEDKMRSKMDAMVRIKEELRKAEEELEQDDIELVAAAADCAAANEAQSKLSQEKAEASSGKAARRAQGPHVDPTPRPRSELSDACHIITLAVQQLQLAAGDTASSEQAAIFIANLQQLAAGLAPAAGLTAAAVVKVRVPSPAAATPTSMAVEAERLRLDAAIEGGKGGKGKGDSFQPYESEAAAVGGKEDKDL